MFLCRIFLLALLLFSSPFFLCINFSIPHLSTYPSSISTFHFSLHRCFCASSLHLPLVLLTSPFFLCIDVSMPRLFTCPSYIKNPFFLCIDVSMPHLSAW